MIPAFPLIQGADRVIPRDEDLVDTLGSDSLEVVVDLVAGPGWPPLLDLLKPGGRYAVAGAIAGPMVALDVRTLYLKDLTFFGCTYQDPVVAKTYGLADIHHAQKDFLTKAHTGKLVLVPPQ